MCHQCDASYSINELSVRDIRSRTDVTDRERVEKAKKLVSYYRGVDSNGDIIFHTKSQTTPGLMYTELIRLYDLPILVKSPIYAGNEQRMLKDAFSGNIGVYCTDPSFLYWGWQYISFTLNFGWHSATYPSIRNPTLYGAVCKHIYHVLMVLPFNFFNIYRDMKKNNFLSIRI